MFYICPINYTTRGGGFKCDHTFCYCLLFMNFRFAITFIDAISTNNPVKLKVWKDESKAMMCRLENDREINTEVTSSFPFISNIRMKISFTFTSTHTQVSYIGIKFNCVCFVYTSVCIVYASVCIVYTSVCIVYTSVCIVNTSVYIV